MSELLPQQVIIGIVGRRWTGKDTFGRLISRHFPEYKCTRMSIGDFIKRDLALMTGGSMDVINANKDNPLLRKVLQFIGGECYDEETNKYWAGRLSVAISEYFNLELGKHTLVYITDIRYPEQAKMVRIMGGLLVKITREFGKRDLIDEHPSESLTDTIVPDFHCPNSSTELKFHLETKIVCTFLRETLEGKMKTICQTPQKTLSSQSELRLEQKKEILQPSSTTS